MIDRCPFCGRELERPLNDGLTFCNHCSRIVQSSDRHRLLSAAWSLRRSNESYQVFQFRTKLSDYEAEFVYGIVAENGCTHDEVVKILDDLGIV